MQLTEYAALDATALAELIRRREVSGPEVYAAALEAIDAVNGELNAVAGGPWERPLDHAADGPFAGVPFVLKDLGPHPQGVPTMSGSRLSGDGVVHAHESFLIRRFRETGLAVAALTTVPELGQNASSEALVHGPTRNPWDLTRSSGGSSGGSAALVAAGAVPAGHASDGGGSIRIPAAFTGLVGLKPSRGRISPGPDSQEPGWGVAVEGVVTRTVRDSAALLDAVAGAMPGDKFAIRDPLRPWSQEVGADAERLRVALHSDSWSGTQVDPEVADATEAVGRRLEQLGHHVERATPRLDWDPFMRAVVTLFAAALIEAVDALAAASGLRPGPDTLERTTFASYERGKTVTALEIGLAMRTMNEVTRTVGDFFTEWDLLVTPTVSVPPLPLGYLDADDASLDADGWLRRIFDVCSFTPLFNCAGTPALSLPLGSTSSGLPIGVQLAAPMCGEDVLIRAGSQLEEAMPWQDRRPDVHAGSR
jgi:amidase